MRSPEAVRQTVLFSRTHRIPETESLAPGFRDGGRRTAFDEAGEPLGLFRREVLTFAPFDQDAALKEALDRVRADAAGLDAVLDKVDVLKEAVADLLAENAPAENKRILEALAGEGGAAGVEITLGGLIAAGTGVCRHRSLLFKVLADQLGVPAALVRGNYSRRGVDQREGRALGDRGGHAWNEVVLETGDRILVDVMHDYVGTLSDAKAGGYATVRDEPLYAGFAGALTPFAPCDAAPEHLDLVRDARWVSAQGPNGRAAYVFLQGMSAESIDRLRSALRSLAIRHDDYQTGLGGNGGRRPVLRVRGAAYLKLLQLGVSANHKTPIVSMTPNTTRSDPGVWARD